MIKFFEDEVDLCFEDDPIMPSNIPSDLIDSLENKNAELADVDSAKESLELEESNSARCRIVSNETSLISNILEIPDEVDKEGVVSVAPGEGK